ncbi:GUN4 domain-containing protein, partial [Planktothrix sp.]
FSVQKRIYQSLGGTRSYNQKVWKAFGDQVGWRVGGSWLYYKDLKFNQTAKEGHLPLTVGRLRWRFLRGGFLGGWRSLLSRPDL